MIYSAALLFGYLMCSPIILKKIKTYNVSLQEWKRGVNLYHNEKYLQSISFFETAFLTLKTDGNFLTQYGKAFIVHLALFLPVTPLLQFHK